MAKAGSELVNKAAEKERIIFCKTATETGGELLEMEAFYKPEGHYPPDHYHPYQDEHFEVLKGRLDVRMNGQEQRYEAGQTFEVPRGTPHAMRNGGDEEASVLWQVRPALKTQAFYETLWGLAGDGKTDKEGKPHLLQLAVMMQEYKDEFVLGHPSRTVQKYLFGALALLGRARGYRGWYEKYSGNPAPEAGREYARGHMRAEASVWIDQSVEEVFSFVANYDNDAQWRNVVTMTQEPKGISKAGTITTEELDFLGQRYRTVARITALEPNRHLMWESIEATTPVWGQRRVQPELGGTRFTEVVEAEFQGLTRLFTPILASMYRRQMEGEVKELKQVLEQRFSYATTPSISP